MKNIDIDELKFTSYKLDGNCSGVYFLFNENELVYIGKGWNCLLRIAEHTRKDSDKIFTSWNYIHIKDRNEYDALENGVNQYSQTKI
jgi:predicted GIY-YIG superfamily endonuclease